jgi:RNA polymerase sigma-70 factor (ECF subfamily)
MTERTDAEVVAATVDAARKGDRKALELLLGRYLDPVYRFGMKMCRDSEDAREVLQDTMLAAARTIGDFRGDASVSTWLYTIARSFCIKRRRRGKHAPRELVSLEQQDAPARDLVDPSRRPDDQAAGGEIARALSAAIEALEPSYREVLVLRDVEGLSAPEVAEVLGLGVEAVKSRLHRARVAVRVAMAPALAGGGTAPQATCPDVVTLFSRKLEGDIDAPTCAEMEQHLAGCRHCTEACNALKETLALCRHAGPEVPPEVQAEVRAAINRFLTLPSSHRPAP